MSAKIFLIIMYLFTLPALARPVQFEDLPKITYSRDPYYEERGYKLGYVIDFGLSGLIPPYRSYEGSMMLGFGSTRKDYYDPVCLNDEMIGVDTLRDPVKKQKLTDQANEKCYIFTNPWHFSYLTSGPYEDYIAATGGKVVPVLIYFVRPIFAFSRIVTDTSEFIEGTYPVNENLKIEKSIRLPDNAMPIARLLHRRSAFIPGRVVSAELQNIIRKSFEVIIQEGPSGSAFRKMSVSDQSIFDFLIKAMLSGKLLNLEYLEITGAENEILRIGKDYDTRFRIVGVQVDETSSLGSGQQQQQK
jgi:hypothetical protein